jgi:hypothetical protein
MWSVYDRNLMWQILLYITEDADSMVLRNVGILQQHYTASQPRRHRHEPSWLSKLKISFQTNIVDANEMDICALKLSLCLTKHHAMNAYWGVEVLLRIFFDLGTRWRWVVSFMTRPLYPQGKIPWYPLDRLGGSQSRSGHGVEGKNSQTSPGIELRSSDGIARSQSLYGLGCVLFSK